MSPICLPALGDQGCAATRALQLITRERVQRSHGVDVASACAANESGRLARRSTGRRHLGVNHVAAASACYRCAVVGQGGIFAVPRPRGALVDQLGETGVPGGGSGPEGPPSVRLTPRPPSTARGPCSPRALLLPLPTPPEVPSHGATCRVANVTSAVCHKCGSWRGIVAVGDPAVFSEIGDRDPDHGLATPSIPTSVRRGSASAPGQEGRVLGHAKRPRSQGRLAAGWGRGLSSGVGFTRGQASPGEMPGHQRASVIRRATTFGG
jgi:hypothetical protein